MKYQVFISYRRGSGLYMAKNIATFLTQKGYRVFFDYTSMRNGEFNTQIYDAIAEAKDFILVLSESALDRCNDNNDWVRNEVLYAKKHKKNIILATDQNKFQYPQVLSEELDFLRRIDWTPIDAKLFDGSMKLLQKRLKSSSVLIPILSVLTLILFVSILSILYMIRIPETKEGQFEDGYRILYPSYLHKIEDDVIDDNIIPFKFSKNQSVLFAAQDNNTHTPDFIITENFISDTTFIKKYEKCGLKLYNDDIIKEVTKNSGYQYTRTFSFNNDIHLWTINIFKKADSTLYVASSKEVDCDFLDIIYKCPHSDLSSEFLSEIRIKRFIKKLDPYISFYFRKECY